MQQTDPSSLETFADIAYYCLQKSREQRPAMSIVVEKLKIALQFQELRYFKPSEYEKIIVAADPPLIYKFKIELKAILAKGFLVNKGETVRHYQVLGYQDIVKVSSQALFNKSLEELKVLLSIGVHLNGYKKWFSLNENGQH
nr:protein kinase-like domain, phloem protein 2-like protein [Tanacetum cinerariifolium]